MTLVPNLLLVFLTLTNGQASLSPTLTVGAELEAISHRPFWAVVVTPCNAYKLTVARGDKGPRCVMRAVGCLPDGSGP